MSRISAWLITVALAQAVWAQPITDQPLDPTHFVHVWDIPALSYGPNEWSILRLTNQSDNPRFVSVQVYSQAGDRLPIGPDFTLNPRQVLDIRIDGNSGKDSKKESMCWARVLDRLDAPGYLDVTPMVEILEGNDLLDYAREIREFSSRREWGFDAPNLRFKSIYFLNGSDKTTMVTFCDGSKLDRKPCQAKTGPVHFTVGPHQSILVDVGRIRQRYLFVVSSAPKSGMVVILKDGQGLRKQFTSESNIQFGERE